jgi:hypothetical protein
VWHPYRPFTRPHGATDLMKYEYSETEEPIAEGTRTQRGAGGAEPAKVHGIFGLRRPFRSCFSSTLVGERKPFYCALVVLVVVV